MAAVVKSKEADDAAVRCRRHPRHRHSAGVCPFCLRDRLSRLSAAAAANTTSPSPSSSTASSPCSSTGEESVASSGQAPPCRRARLGALMRQEQRETTATAAAALGAGREQQQQPHLEAPEEKKTKAARRNGFWARLQQQLQYGSWHKKDGCSLAHSNAVGEKTSAPAKRPVALV
ncbi:hypothetical protein ABZP36_020934 [Zizania latifolia]